MDEIKKLIGAEVNFVRFSHQIDIDLLGGENRERKYANLQIAAPFEFKINTESFTIDPEKSTTLAPIIKILHTILTNIELTESYELSLTFSNDSQLTIKPIEQYEAWNLTGDDLPYFVAVGN